MVIYYGGGIMKAMQINISLTQKRKKIMRTLIVSKKTTYEQLHEMIQILFNLDCCEEYSFEIDKKWIQKDEKHSELKTLVRLKENDIFYYHYDLIDSLHFKIEVLNSIESSIVPLCTQIVGKNLYEGIQGNVESKYQSDVDINWINESLSYYQETKQAYFYEQVKESIQKLSKIRFFQDFMHNQIIQIHLPQNRVVYMGCDASEDVILNFHINSNKLMEYTSINQRSISQSIIKYHDCIELSMLKRSRLDEKMDFDFNVGNYGIFLSHANVFSNEIIPVFYMNIYLHALRQYVKVIEYCQKNELKFVLGKMLVIDTNDEIQVCDGKMVIYNIAFLEEKEALNIKEKYSMHNTKVEVDVLTFPKGINDLETICIVGDNVNGYLECEIHCSSLKTMLVKIFMLLQKRWEMFGMDKTIVLRDLNLKKEFEKICEQFGIECQYENQLTGIDAKYILGDKHVDLENMDPKTILLRILEELGIDMNELQHVDATSDIVEKIQSIKDSKKYS